MMVAEASAAGLHVMAHAHGEGAKAAVRNGVRSIEHGHFLDDETLAMMAERGTWLVPTLSAGVGLRRAIEAGVRIAMGTDAPLYPHGENLLELELLVEQGLTTADALHAATLSAAELMGLEATLGSPTPGKRADLVVVDGDPLDVRDLGKRVLAVYQDGEAVHLADRDPVTGAPPG
jgi:imidazolonepropionase-like amidohydrolase